MIKFHNFISYNNGELELINRW